ncbi:ATP-NAD kinase family protein [Gilvimarinus sp. DA14]|uniref:ATP-NAD kinase family protein n=1 Tax=Gilvimarinus sp. DA14 TaxID=2956798 RepID=UPI0020B761EC|nr:ATP-NAD kinase family protein [Gilvimarinus sp. DA14]UTF61374.1 ATP-NAD kinase family protein [Gilvimarinus sp. DA14]
MTKLTLGLIVNPCAGLGGSLALKGSDAPDTLVLARQAGVQPQAPLRMQRALTPLLTYRDDVRFFTFAASMGESLLQSMGFIHQVLGQPKGEITRADDTLRAAQCFREAQVDLLVFAGGDGTARVIADAVGMSLPCLGVPAGVKIHSGVYTTSPEAAGRVLERLARGQWAPLVEREVRDIDERAFRQGRVKARHYSELLVPEMPDALQQVKNAGAQVDELAQLDLADGVIETLNPDTLYLLGPGSTTQVILQQLGLEGTLLGVDVLQDGKLLACDVSAADIRRLLDGHLGPVAIIVTAIGGQGHIFGRGNQQLACDIIARVGRENIQVVATAEKLKALDGRPLLVDTNDPELDRALAGVMSVTTGYQTQVLYPVGDTF